MNNKLKMNQWLIIADDLTGANDSSVTFADYGFNTILINESTILSVDVFKNYDVCAISSNTRPLFSRAKEITTKILEGCNLDGPQNIFIKIDSTMRGSVNEQIEGMLAYFQSHKRKAKAIICPAYPDLNRIIKGGRLYVDNIPVNETASGKDIICPVASADIADLITGSITVGSIVGLKNALKENQSDKIIIDAINNDDLDEIATFIKTYDKELLIPVGSAGLASALAKASNHPMQYSYQMTACKKILVLVSSIHETSQGQVDHYISSPAGAESIIFSPHPAQLLSDDAHGALIEQLDMLSQIEKGNFFIRANPVTFSQNKYSRDEFANRVAQALAKFAKYLLNHKSFDGVILFGGDGAQAFMKEMAITGLSIKKTLMTGVPVALTIPGDFLVLTKSGGFGNRNLLSDLIDTLEKGDINE